ncbi:hypothetical protein P8452_07590 [Trifolium repens]|nr:hypothetical protein P8452_07590 [Trifolium repens]
MLAARRFWAGIEKVKWKEYESEMKQVLIRDGNKVTFDEANPFANDIYLGARCEVHSIVELNKQSSFLIVNALNEFDSKYSCVDWRQKLEIPRGVVFAGADMMKLVGIRTSLVKLKIVNSTQTKTATLLRLN